MLDMDLPTGAPASGPPKAEALLKRLHSELEDEVGGSAFQHALSSWLSRFPDPSSLDVMAASMHHLRAVASQRPRFHSAVSRLLESLCACITAQPWWLEQRGLSYLAVVEAVAEKYSDAGFRLAEAATLPTEAPQARVPFICVVQLLEQRVKHLRDDLMLLRSVPRLREEARRTGVVMQQALLTWAQSLVRMCFCMWRDVTAKRRNQLLALEAWLSGCARRKAYLRTTGVLKQMLWHHRSELTRRRVLMLNEDAAGHGRTADVLHQAQERQRDSIALAQQAAREQQRQLQQLARDLVPGEGHRARARTRSA